MGQTFSTHLGGAQPRKEGMRGAALRFFLEDFCQFLETDFCSSKTELLETENFKLRAMALCVSRREIKIDV